MRKSELTREKQRLLWEELKWSWVINAEEYEEIYFVNDTMVALKNDAGKWGIIDLTNDKVIALFLYDDVSIFHNNFIRLKKDDNIYFMNTMGVFWINVSFKMLETFLSQWRRWKKINYGGT